MKFKEMTQLTPDDRRLKLKELQLELIKLNTQVATGTPPKNAGTVSRIKKDIARMMLIETLSREKTILKSNMPKGRSAPKEKPKQKTK